MSLSAYEHLEKRFRRMSHLGHLASIANWDQAVHMPTDSGEARAEALAEYEVILVELMKSHEMAQLFDQAGQDIERLSPWQKANFQEMHRSWRRANALDEDLVEALSKAKSKCELAWRTLRKNNNWKDFLPLFESVVSLTREEAHLRSETSGLGPYDALLDLYEPGHLSADIDPLFEELKRFLPSFLDQVIEKQKSERFISPQGPFDISQQEKLGRRVLEILGFDFNRGRLDVSHHPFCGGVPQDVRITTRYDQSNFTDSLMGIIHETGHARYEQGLPRAWAAQPVGTARSMSIHESQSLFFEFQIGRGHPFLSFVAPLLKQELMNPKDNPQAWTEQNLYRYYTRVKKSFIRVGADEVSYPLHIILRYEIEKDLIAGKIEPKDLPDIWNHKMQSYLGLSTQDNYRDGIMQDIHWPGGAFGYFPTYTLGAMSAAQFYTAAKRDLPDIEERISRGDLAPIWKWLETHIWSKASSISVDDILEQATGETLNARYFEDHLKRRYLS